MDDMNMKPDPSNADLYALMLRLAAQQDNLVTDLVETRGLVTRMTHQLDNLAGDVAGLKTDVAGLKTDMRDIKIELGTLGSQVEVLSYAVGKHVNDTRAHS